MYISALTDVGKVRANNEDSFDAGIFPDNETAWAVVCDGMGGVSGGSIASAMCVETVKKRILSGYRENISEKSVESILESALITSNIEVYKRAADEPELFGMGTTAVALFVSGAVAVIAHAGDSRAYLIKDNSINQITKDHSVVQYLTDIGQITPEQAKYHPERNVITRAIGVDKDIDIDIDVQVVEPGDVILLCTDGLSGYVDDGDILRIYSESENGDVKCLIDAALEAGGGDNITVVAVKC